MTDDICIVVVGKDGQKRDITCRFWRAYMSGNDGLPAELLVWADDAHVEVIPLADVFCISSTKPLVDPRRI